MKIAQKLRSNQPHKTARKLKPSKRFGTVTRMCESRNTKSCILLYTGAGTVK